jgi:hypothetical protein
MSRFSLRIVGACATTLALAACHTMNPFAADLGRMDVGGKAVRPAYLSSFGYFGHIGAADMPSAVAGGEPHFHVYFWLPTRVPELGVRFLSHVNGWARPDAQHDVVEAAFSEHKKDDTFFDPAIRLERCLGVVDAADAGRPCSQWAALGENDDSPEMPANPDGHYTNSLLRVGTHVEDPQRALVRGLYRVSFVGAKSTPVAGTYLMQVGMPTMVEHVAMGRTPEDVAKQVLQRAGELPLQPSIGHTGTAPHAGALGGASHAPAADAAAAADPIAQPL